MMRASSLLLLTSLLWAGLLVVPAAAQVSVDLGGVGDTVDAVTDTVDDTVDTAGEVVGGAVDSAGGLVDGASGAVGETLDGATGGALDGAATTLDQEVALEAVRADRALPLERILARAREFFRGEIVDARLISVRGFLLYELKVIEADGDVSQLYFYARSGEPVQTSQ